MTCTDEELSRDRRSIDLAPSRGARLLSADVVFANGAVLFVRSGHQGNEDPARLQLYLFGFYC